MGDTETSGVAAVTDTGQLQVTDTDQGPDPALVIGTARNPLA